MSDPLIMMPLMTKKRSDEAVELVRAQLGELFDRDLHAKRVLSLGNATLGVLRAGALGVHAIGVGLAREMDLNPKHAVKQVDRLLSNKGIQPWELFAHWVPYVLAQRTEALVALDWTDFDAEGQTTLMLHLVSSHGRSTPLVWKSVWKDELKDRQTEVEDQVIARFLEIAPRETKVTLLADRGFADQKLYALLAQWNCDYVIRMRGNIAVESERGEIREARDWVPKNGHAVRLPNARVTVRGRTPVPAIVCVRKARMKDSWCLATSRADLRAGKVVQLYSRRFTIEESFRDTKDPRFGMGLVQARVNSLERRDRLLLVAALAIGLLTLLGGAGESLGFERWLKANTSKKRTYSLLRQGQLYYDLLPGMRSERADLLLLRFIELLHAQEVFRLAFGIL
jgi:hypothetical protein